WGKLKFLDGGDLISACGVACQPGVVRGRDKSFVKYTLEVDQNKRYKNQPVILEKRAYYGQVLHFIALKLPPTCPFIQAHPSRIGQPSSHIMAVIMPIKPLPTPLNEFGMPSYKKLGPIQVVDASTIECVVGRVKDRDTWTIIERHSIIQHFGEELEAASESRGDLG
ncbi:hypothetical protein BD779DRAFT_1766114, partial [Infundibulicybe gibba]